MRVGWVLDALKEGTAVVGAWRTTGVLGEVATSLGLRWAARGGPVQAARAPGVAATAAVGDGGRDRDPRMDAPQRRTHSTRTGNRARTRASTTFTNSSAHPNSPPASCSKSRAFPSTAPTRNSSLYPFLSFSNPPPALPSFLLADLLMLLVFVHMNDRYTRNLLYCSFSSCVHWCPRVSN